MRRNTKRKTHKRMRNKTRRNKSKRKIRRNKSRHNKTFKKRYYSGGAASRSTPLVEVNNYRTTNDMSPIRSVGDFVDPRTNPYNVVGIKSSTSIRDRERIRNTTEKILNQAKWTTNNRMQGTTVNGKSLIITEVGQARQLRDALNEAYAKLPTRSPTGSSTRKAWENPSQTWTRQR
jgi:hypothetical protein